MSGASVKGDFAKLARLQAQVKRLATDDVRVRLANVVGAAALAQLQLGFRLSRDPYGVAWAPIVSRKGKPLLDTGRLRSSFSYAPHAGHFVIGTNVVYMAHHQYGTRRGLRARMMVPEGHWGAIWSKAIHDASLRFLAREMRP